MATAYMDEGTGFDWLAAIDDGKGPRHVGTPKELLEKQTARPGRGIHPPAPGRESADTKRLSFRLCLRTARTISCIEAEG